MKIGRNDPCPCGSGLKYKKCCASKDEAALAARLAAEAAAAAATPPADETVDPATADPAGDKADDARANRQPAAPSKNQPKGPVQAHRMPVRRKPV